MTPFGGAFSTPGHVVARIPGSAVPRTGARVVSFGGLDPHTSPLVAARLPSFGLDAASVRSVGTNISNSADPVYIPYVHVDTGMRALVPCQVTPATGARRPLVPVPVGYMPDVIYTCDAAVVPAKNMVTYKPGRMLPTFLVDKLDAAWAEEH
jgi:hypothetical protein